MPKLPMELELERVMNIVRGFGWEQKKWELVGDDLVLTIKKRYLKADETPEVVVPT